MINLRLHRKQVLILGFSGLLAVAAYWIPAPQSSVSAFSEIINSANHSPEEAESILIHGNWPYPLEKHSALI